MHYGTLTNRSVLHSADRWSGSERIAALLFDVGVFAREDPPADQGEGDRGGRVHPCHHDARVGVEMVEDDAAEERAERRADLAGRREP